MPESAPTVAYFARPGEGATTALGALLVTAFELAFHFVQEAFAASQPAEQVLRFDGSRALSRELALTLPAAASVVSATLEIEESFGSSRALGGQGGAATQRGVEVAPDR